MFKTRFISMLVLLAAVVTGAWAQEQSETIATTAKIVEGTHFTISNNDYYADGDGMNADGGITVTPKNGETITKVVISCTYHAYEVEDGNTSVSSGTKEITNGGGTITVTGVNASTFTFTCSDSSPQFSQFVVYYTEASAASTYTVTLKEGTEDATSWTITPAEATTTGVAAGTEVKATYGGTKKVKSVKAVKKAPAAPAVTDLSMVDCAGNARDKQWTANCYMVHTAGDYKLPLVYGNAIKDGADNTAAYTGVSGDNTTATFPRHDDQAITAPWIKDNGITVTQAELLWQDAEGLITAAGIDGDYLTLTVGKDATTQEGNALVAAKTADGTIVWSWHIWVTKQTFSDLTTITASGYDYSVTPVNLGWVGDATSTTGYNTYYQWGRKDAFIPSTGTGDIDHTVYNISNATVSGFSFTQDNSITIGGNIQQPTVYYYNNSNYSPCNSTYSNIWDAQLTSTDVVAAATVKTVYDPCPSGFCVPTSGLYSYISSLSKPAWNTGYTLSGVYFPASGRRSYSNGTLSKVGSGGYYWSAVPANISPRYIRSFGFDQNYLHFENGFRTYGYSVRAVAE